MDIFDAIKDSIQVEEKELEPCLLEATYTIPAAKAKETANGIASSLCGQVNIPGFRKGHAPVAIIRNKFKKEIQGESLSSLISSAFRKTSEVEGREVLTYRFPEGAKLDYEVGVNEDFTFTLLFNTAPNIELPDYKGVKVEGPAVDSEAADKVVEEQIDKMRKDYGEFAVVDGAAETGDMLKVSYTSDLELPEEATDYSKRLANAEENYFWLNDNEILPGVNAALVGAKAGDEREVTITFPEDYYQEDLAGKSGAYKIKALEIQRKQPLESDERLCAVVRVENMDKLRETLRERAVLEQNASIHSVVQSRVLEKLCADLDFPVPPDLLKDSEEGEIRRLTQMKAQELGNDKEKLEAEKDAIEKEAKEQALKNLRQNLLLRKIAKLEDISVEEAEVDQQIRGISMYMGYKDDELKKRLMSSGNIQKIADDVLIRKVSDFLADNAEVTPEAKSSAPETEAAE